jgi:carbon-monoxide dehydrogenase large subunit
MTFAVQADGQDVTTAAGLSYGEKLNTLQSAFQKHHALQCGYCTPGMLCAATDLLKRVQEPAEEEIRQAMRGNLCRCTGYQHIVEAISAAAGAGSVAPAEDESYAAVANVEWKGRPLPRLEDTRLLLGRGRYVDDITLPGQLYAAFLRSPLANAEVLEVDVSQALACAGVVAVYTADDLELTDIKPNWVLPGSQPKGRKPLASGRVLHVGEPIAVVVAESGAQAVDALQLITVRYEERLPLLDATEAVAGARKVHDDLPNNVATMFRTGNGGYDNAAAASDRTISLDLVNQRVIPFPLEPRAVNASYEFGGKLTLYISHQIPHMLRRMLAENLGFPEQKLRVVSPDVGGGFGPKMHVYPEEVVLCHATQLLGRPVKWTETRSENMVATTHGRDHRTKVDVAVRKDGKILGLRVHSTANVGAYLSTMGGGVPTINVGLFALGVYEIPASEIAITCVYTNTTPVDAYRGAGRPEAAYLIERTIERVALELGLDPAEVRSVNFIRREKLPYRQPAGTLIDSGQFETTMRTALELADYPALRAMQSEARSQGRYIGIGFSNYTETCGMGAAELLGQIGFDRGGFESATVRLHPDGRATVLSGSHSHGQGHVTTFAQIAADELGILPEDVDVIQGDTDAVPFGIGTFNSRSVAVGGSAVKVAAGKVAKRMKQMAACLLKVEPERVELKDGLFRCEGVEATRTLRDVGRAAWTGQGLSRDIGIGLEETEFYHPSGMSSPYGTHLAVVEVDAETGEVSLLRYFAVDDCGEIINPLLARGQVHGGLAQGLGQALFEEAAFSPEGRIEHEAAVPRFDTTISFETAHTVTPTPTNVLGAKGIGEAGTIAAPPAIVNAAIDALWPLGVRSLEMPLTPQRVAAAIKSNKIRVAEAAE